MSTDLPINSSNTVAASIACDSSASAGAIIADIPKGVRLNHGAIQETFQIHSTHSGGTLNLDLAELKDLASVLCGFFGEHVNDFLEVGEYIHEEYSE